MKLTKGEIKYLATSFVPQTPISVFANIDAVPEPDVYQNLTAKGVIVGNAYAKEALDLLTLLAKPDRGARFFAQTPDFVMEKYTYRIGDKLILAENNEGVLDFSVVDNVTSLASRFSEAFGISAYGADDIQEIFTPAETVALFAAVDLTRKRRLAGYADLKTGSGGFSAEEILAEAGCGYKNGLTGLFLKNYRLEVPSADTLREALPQLLSRKILAGDAASGYAPAGQYDHFANNFLIIETIAMYEAFSMLPGGEVATIARIAASAGKNEAFAVFFDGDLVQFNATSPLQLLHNIEAFMSCPSFEPPKPAASPAPAPIPAPAPAAAPAPAPAAAPQAAQAQQVAPGTWTCTCGKTNTGNFCGGCGSRKP